MANKKLKIVVTGADGQLGQCLQELAPHIPHQFTFTNSAELDITNAQSIREVLEAEKPDWVINCAAYTAVDRAEEEPDAAKLLNTTAAGLLATETAAQKVGILHISTDYVYGGENPAPLGETEPTNPRSVYGRTKLEGEELVAANNPHHIILRTSWLYSAHGNNFVKTMLRLGGEKTELNVVGDQWGCPTSAHDLAKAIIVAIEKPVYGTYHFSGMGSASWALLAQEAIDLAGLSCTVNHITTSEYPTAAVRPQYTLLSKEKFSTTFGTVIPEWEHSLEEVIGRLGGK